MPWRLLKCDFVVPFFGVAHDPNSRIPVLVSDWMPNGNLRQFVRDRSDLQPSERNQKVSPLLYIDFHHL